jgi:cytochrome b-561
VLRPALLLAVLTLWPWWDKSPAAAAGAWLSAGRRRQVWVFLAVCLAILVLTLIGTFLRGPYWHFYWPWEPWPEVPGRI